MTRTRRTLRTLSLSMSAVLTIGCSALTDIDAPDVLEPEKLENPAGALALRAGAITRFTESMANPTLEYGQVGGSGLMSDEFTSTLGRLSDRRSISTGVSEYPDQTLHVARVAALAAIPAMQKYSPNPGSRIGELFGLIAFTELFFGENMCSGIPLGAIVNGAPVYGAPLTRLQMLERAIADFDSTLVYAADSARILNMARVGRARALLNLGRFADAANAVAAVPTSFVYSTQHSASAQQNGLFVSQYSSRTLSVSNSEGVNGLNFRTANDPRVPTQFIGIGNDGVTQVYAFTRYNSATSAIPFASGLEARLIQAEVELRNNPSNSQPTGSGWLGILNTLRATAIAPALPALSDPGTPESRLNLLFRERAFWLFATGHRHGDMRRLVTQYGRAVETVFPTGVYRAGLSYGTSVVFMPSEREQNNPNFGGCIDVNP
jgi:starch-binding outer membrane protein, SusD/RagB family